MKMEEVTGGGERGGSSSGTLLSLGLRAILLQVLRQEEEEEGDPDAHAALSRLSAFLASPERKKRTSQK